MGMSPVHLLSGAMVVLLAGCGAVRVAPREPSIDETTRARITRLGCGDTTAADSLQHARTGDTRVAVRQLDECAALLGWMARWMGERFATWSPAASPDDATVERFALLRDGDRLVVYQWFRRAEDRPGGRGIAYEIDLRRRGEGITGFSF